MSAFYNEFDRFPAAWMRSLIDAGHISPGIVDERSIADLKGSDLDGFDRAHFFAGIGGWDYALHLAGWPADAPVWTGSCPCQPFSAAGKQKGTADERHLWPELRRLIAECRPPVVFGEQVASALGRDWLASVRADLEALGYAVGSADLCAAGEGAPHIRQRLYWVAYAECGSAERYGLKVDGAQGACALGEEERERVWNDGRNGCEPSVVAYSDASGQRAGGGPVRDERNGFGGSMSARVMVYPRNKGLSGHRGLEQEHDSEGWTLPRERHAGPAGVWSECDWLPCRDGKLRSVEPGTFPLAHGIPARVGRLRGYGNAIVPQVAATFVRAFMECIA